MKKKKHGGGHNSVCSIPSTSKDKRTKICAKSLLKTDNKPELFDFVKVGSTSNFITIVFVSFFRAFWFKLVLSVCCNSKKLNFLINYSISLISKH